MAEATTIQVSREVVENNKTGFLVNPLAVDGLAKKIILLLAGSPERLSKTAFVQPSLILPMTIIVLIHREVLLRYEFFLFLRNQLQL